MKEHRLGSVVAVAVASLVLQGCVSAGKHKEMERQKTSVEVELGLCRGQNRTCEEKVVEQAAWIRELETRVGKNTTDKAKLETSLSETRKALEEMAKRKQEADARIAEFAQLADKFKTLVDAGRLSVKIVDGRMVVALSSDVLFASGSAKLSSEGQASIREVGGLLATIPNRQFQIEGHTDNVPIQTAQFPSNWELASARALTVLKEMIASGLPSQRISAASFGENKPARPNDSKEGRIANRRIEIVIVPDLSSLPGFEELRKMSEPGT